MNENQTNQNEVQNAPIPLHIFTGLLAAQSELANPTKDTQGYGYKYATLDSLITLVKPILSKHGVGIYQAAGKLEDNTVVIKTVLFHESGQHLIEQAQVPIKFGSNPVQDYGASLTYGKRYALLGLLNICPADEDTDGVGSQPVKKKAPAKKAPAPKKQPIRDAKLVDDVDARLAELAIIDWAEATGFVPHRTKEENLKRFLDLSDDEIFAKVEAWRNKAA
jgi:hypothetical protein